MPPLWAIRFPAPASFPAHLLQDAPVTMNGPDDNISRTPLQRTPRRSLASDFPRASNVEHFGEDLFDLLDLHLLPALLGLLVSLSSEYPARNVNELGVGPHRRF